VCWNLMFCECVCVGGYGCVSACLLEFTGV